MSKEISITEKSLVTKSNQLIEARYKLTLREQRFVLLMVSMIEPDDEDFTYYEIPARDLIKHLRLEKEHDAYKRVRKLVQGMQRRILTIHKEDGGFVDIVWVASADYSKNSLISFEFSRRLKPYLLQLSREFTTYKLINIVRLQSSHAIRIYELLKGYERIGKRVIQLDDFRLLLRIENSPTYALYGNIKSKILLPAQKEIARHTDISFTFKEIKRGRKVVELRFTIKAKKSTNDLFPTPLDEPTPTIVKEVMTVLSKRDATKIWKVRWSYLDKEAQALVAPLITDGLAFDQYLREKLQLLKVSQKKQKIAEPKAWLKRAIKENWIDAQQERSRTSSKRRAEFQKRAQETDARRQQEDSEMRNKRIREMQLDSRYMAISPAEQVRINKQVYERLLAMDDFKAQRVEIERVVDEISSGEDFFQHLPAGVGITAQRIRRDIVANNE